MSTSGEVSSLSNKSESLLEYSSNESFASEDESSDVESVVGLYTNEPEYTEAELKSMEFSLSGSSESSGKEESECE